MKNYFTIVSLSHPPYSTEQKSGPSVNSPLPEHVELAFKYSREYGSDCIGDIWINWTRKDAQGNTMEHREMLFAVSKLHNCCFVVRMIGLNGVYQNLVWNIGVGSEPILTIEDSGCGDWRFKSSSKVPVSNAIELAKRFAEEGDTGDDLTWEPIPYDL